MAGAIPGTTAVILTPFQARVLARYAMGEKIAQIAKEEYTNERKIRTEFENIRIRFGVQTTAAAILVAHKSGYISLPDDAGLVHAQSPFS